MLVCLIMSQVLDIQVSRLAVGMIIIDISMEVKSFFKLFLWSGISKIKILAVNFNFSIYMNPSRFEV